MSTASAGAETQANAADITPIPGLMELWAETLGDPRICIAVLDTAVDISHPCFTNANIIVADLLSRGRPQTIHATRHGTHVASILFGQHDTRVKGIAPRCKGVVVPIYDPDAGLSCSQDELAFAIEESIRHGANVICVSGGERSNDGRASSRLAQAVERAFIQGCLIVAAAGNDGCFECLHVPGALPNVLAVGAMDNDGNPLEQSNWGSVYSLQGVLAPGKDILGAWPAGGVSTNTGTSFAATIVAGVAALLASIQLRRFGRHELSAVRKALLQSAWKCDAAKEANCEKTLAGRVNIQGAYALIVSQSGVITMSEVVDQEQQPTLDVGLNRGVEPRFGSSTACTAGSVLPSDCGCGGGKARETVFVIGDRLWYDFGTLIRQSSIEDSYNGFIRTPNDLLRYLFGYKADHQTAKATGKATIGGNLFDAEAVYWVLYQGDCPRYALRPVGPFASAIYKAILTFFIENNGLENADFLDECLQGYYECHGGLSTPFRTLGQSGATTGSSNAAEEHATHSHGGHPNIGPNHPIPLPPPSESGKTFDPGEETALFFGERATEASHLAIPGQISGEVRLLNGRTVPVINPQLRGMASWNTLGLVKAVEKYLHGKDATTFIVRLASRLYRLTRNNGISPEDRAKNWAATHFIQSFSPLMQSKVFRDFLGVNAGPGTFVSAAVNDIAVKSAECKNTGMEYDVEISLYDTENFLRGLTAVTVTVDVSDVVPVTTSKYQIESRPK